MRVLIHVDYENFAVHRRLVNLKTARHRAQPLRVQTGPVSPTKIPFSCPALPSAGSAKRGGSTYRPWQGPCKFSATYSPVRRLQTCCKFGRGRPIFSEGNFWSRDSFHSDRQHANVSKAYNTEHAFINKKVCSELDLILIIIQ